MKRYVLSVNSQKKTDLRLIIVKDMQLKLRLEKVRLLVSTRMQTSSLLPKDGITRPLVVLLKKIGCIVVEHLMIKDQRWLRIMH